MKYHRISFSSYRLFLFGLLIACVFFPVSVRAASPLSEEALASLIKPSVVRIAEHVTGTAKITGVKVDIKRKTIEVLPDHFTEVPVDEFLTGSGFIVHADGYIATNAHVVSLETLKTMLASESALSAIFENALSLNEEEMQQFLDDEDGKKFSREIIHFIIEHSVFDLEHEIAVLRPGAKEIRMGQLMAAGFPAKIVSVNDQFFDDERDVAIIQIAEHDLPALSLGRSEDLSVGKKVFIFGFPATAEINQKDPSEATFTRGVVSAIRETEDGNLKIFQTDAKVSQGSSGGPLFNEYGEVLGMITFQTDELSRAAGDNFAFALTVDMVKKQALEARILPEEGVYGQAFRSGLDAFSEKHCDTALTSFDQAKHTHDAFLVSRYLSPYILKCQEWQSGGESRDTYWEEFRDGVSTLGNPLIYTIGASLFSFGILGTMVFWLLRQLRREEREIVFLERRLRAGEQELRRHEERVSRGIISDSQGSLRKK